MGTAISAARRTTLETCWVFRYSTLTAASFKGVQRRPKTKLDPVMKGSKSAHATMRCGLGAGCYNDGGAKKPKNKQINATADAGIIELHDNSDANSAIGMADFDTDVCCGPNLCNGKAQMVSREPELNVAKLVRYEVNVGSMEVSFFAEQGNSLGPALR